MASPRSVWWLAGGTLFLAAFATTSLLLAGVTFAGLQLIGGTRPGVPRAGAVLIGVLALAAIVVPRMSAADAVVGTFRLFAAVGFVVTAWCAPGPFLGRATGAIGWAAASALGLAWILNGANLWGLLAWDSTRHTSMVLRTMAELVAAAVPSDPYAKVAPVAHFLTTVRPALEVLWGYAGLAVGWQWHEWSFRRRLEGRPN